MNKAVTVIGILLFGCSDPLDSIPLDFAAEPVGGEEQVREWSVARTETGDHQVVVRRALRTGVDCHSLEAHLMRNGDTYTVRVSASPDQEPRAGETVCGYTAMLRDVPSGRYHLRIVHAPNVTGKGAELVMDHPIRIQ